MNSWSLYSHPVLLLRLKDTVSLSQQGEKAQPGCKETKGKKPARLDQQLQCAASKPPDTILYVLNPPRSDLLMIYWIQPLILKSLMFSWPVSALSTHQFFSPLFQSQPSIKSPEPGEEPPCHGKSFSTSPLCTN